MRLKTILVAIAVLSAAPAGVADTVGAPVSAASPTTVSAALPATLAVPAFSMHYDVLHGSMKLGEATFTLERKGGDWVFHWQAQATGFVALFWHSVVRESSRFDVADGRLRPFVYSYTDSGHPDRNEAIRFDWDEHTAFDTNDGQKKKIALLPGMLDRISSQLAISRRLAAGLSLPTTYRVINGGRVRTYTVKKLRKETIKTPAGKFDTVVVQRSDSDSDKTYVFWLAPKYAWLPVRLEQREPGETTDTSVLTRLKWLSVPAPAAATNPETPDSSQQESRLR